MKNKILFERGGFRFTMMRTASKEVVELVSNTVWGTPGKTQWRQMLTKKFLPLIIEPYWFSLVHNNKILSTLVLANRKVSSAKGTVNGYFIRYLTFDKKLRSDARKKTKKTGKNNIFERSPIRKCMLDLFDAPEKINSEKKESEKTVFYAFVELKNSRSLVLCENFGFKAIRNFSTVPFSRFFPKKNTAVRKIEEEDKPDFLNLLCHYYEQYNFFFTEHVFYVGDYFVLKKEGEIIAGLQIIQENWKIDHLPGISGKIILSLLPKIPLISRIFNPKDFRLALFESIYVKEGQEAELICLMESVLAEYNLYSAFIWLDSQCPLYKTLRHFGKLGFLNQLKGDAYAQVVARFENFSEEEIDQFKTRPAYLSAFDMA